MHQGFDRHRAMTNSESSSAESLETVRQIAADRRVAGVGGQKYRLRPYSTWGYRPWPC